MSTTTESRQRVSSNSLAAPVDLTDHVGVIRYLHDRFSAGDMDTIRGFCTPDFKHFPGSLDESTPKGATHSCGISFIRGSFGFDDFVSQMGDMMGQVDWSVKALDYFHAPTTSDIMVHSEISATGRNNGKKITFNSWEAWNFNEKNQVQTLHCLYDPLMWKQVL
jgi:hypothetical protein